LGDIINHDNYNCEVILESGEQYRVFANWMHNQELDTWQGWTCHAGNKRLYIDKNFDVFGGECKNDFLGSAITGFEILNHTVCRRERCTGCTDDLMVEKHAPGSIDD